MKLWRFICHWLHYRLIRSAILSLFRPYTLFRIIFVSSLSIGINLPQWWIIFHLQHRLQPHSPVQLWIIFYIDGQNIFSRKEDLFSLHLHSSKERLSSSSLSWMVASYHVSTITCVSQEWCWYLLLPHVPSPGECNTTQEKIFQICWSPHICAFMYLRSE